MRRSSVKLEKIVTTRAYVIRAQGFPNKYKSLLTVRGERNCAYLIIKLKLVSIQNSAAPRG